VALSGEMLVGRCPSPGRIWLCWPFLMRRVLGPAFSSLALFLIVFVTRTYLEKVRPLSESSAVVPCVGVWLFVNIMYNFLKASFMDPGLPPEFDPESWRLAELGEPAPVQCKKCLRAKPPRAHHCSVCGRCVLKMDHHCPWINNCVGFANYRHFCLFVLYLSIGCVFVIVEFAPLALASVADGFTGDAGVQEAKMARLRSKLFLMGGGDFLALVFRCTSGTWSITGPACIIVAFMLCVVALLAMCLLGGTHLFLLLRNLTTLEMRASMKDGSVCSRRKNRWDLGWRRNVHEVFGPDALWKGRWLLPCIARVPEGSGLEFPSSSSS